MSTSSLASGSKGGPSGPEGPSERHEDDRTFSAGKSNERHNEQHDDNVQVVRASKRDLALATPFRALFQGPSQTGKSTLMLNILKNKRVFYPHITFSKVAYFFPEGGMTPRRREYVEQLREVFPQLEVAEGLPKTQNVLEAATGDPNLCIVDDLYLHLAESFDFQNLLVHGSSHANCNLFISTQNLFSGSKYNKTIHRQITDWFVFPGKGELQPLALLSRQLFDDRDFLPDCMRFLERVHARQYDRVIWIDTNSMSQLPRQLQVRANILDEHPLVFTKRSKRGKRRR